MTTTEIYKIAEDKVFWDMKYSALVVAVDKNEDLIEYYKLPTNDKDKAEEFLEEMKSINEIIENGIVEEEDKDNEDITIIAYLVNMEKYSITQYWKERLVDMED